MNRLTILLTGLSLMVLTSFDSEELPKEFVQLLDRAKMTIEQPKGFVQTRPIENEQMNYEYALINENKDFEVRYAIRPLDELIADYNEGKKNKTSGISVHPNKWHSASFEATVLNISGGQFPEPTIFDSEAVKEEFNADWGATSFVEVGKEFGQEYKYCVVVSIHKDNVGDAYIFYLSKKKETIENNMESLFHLLKFK